MSHVPNWWQFTLLALAAFRIWMLIAEDSILDKPRRWILRTGNEWKEDGDPLPPNYRVGLGNFAACPWCLGFWLTIAWWGAWLAESHWTLVAATPFAISAVVGVLGDRLGPE